MSKNAVKNRSARTSAIPAPAAAASEQQQITEAERTAQPAATSSTETARSETASTDNEKLGGSGPDLGGAAQASAFGADQAAAPDQRMTGQQLVELVAMSKGLLVRLAARSLKVPAEVVEQLAPIQPGTKALLSGFADQAASYLPALNANAPLIGALAFAGVLAADLMGAWNGLKAASPKAQAQRADADQAQPRSTVVGAEDIDRSI